MCDNFHGFYVALIVVSVQFPFPDDDPFYQTHRVIQYRCSFVDFGDTSELLVRLVLKSISVCPK